MNMFRMGALTIGCCFAASGLSAASVAFDEEQRGRDLDNMSDQELTQELLQSLKDACDGMGKLEGELAKASLPEPKVDERYATLKAIVERLGAGEQTEVPEGLKRYFKNHPDKLAELLGMTGDEAKALLEKDDELATKLGDANDKLAELLKAGDAMEEVVKLQGEVESDLTRSIEAQATLGEQTRRDIEEALEAAYALRKQGQGEGAPSQQPQNQPGEKPQGDQDGKDVPPKNANQPSDDARSEYTPGSGEKPNADVGSEGYVDDRIWKADKPQKEQERGNGSTESPKEPHRYKDMWDQFEKALGKMGNKDAAGYDGK